MSFEENIKLSFLENNPGNTTAYTVLSEKTKAKYWTFCQWEKIRKNYYINAGESPKAAWLWDIYKNKNMFDSNKTYIDIKKYLDQNTQTIKNIT